MINQTKETMTNIQNTLSLEENLEMSLDEVPPKTYRDAFKYNTLCDDIPKDLKPSLREFNRLLSCFVFDSPQGCIHWKNATIGNTPDDFRGKNKKNGGKKVFNYKNRRFTAKKVVCLWWLGIPIEKDKRVNIDMICCDNNCVNPIHMVKVINDINTNEPRSVTATKKKNEKQLSPTSRLTVDDISLDFVLQQFGGDNYPKMMDSSVAKNSARILNCILKQEPDIKTQERKQQQPHLCLSEGKLISERDFMDQLFKMIKTEDGTLTHSEIISN